MCGELCEVCVRYASVCEVCVRCEETILRLLTLS